MRARRRGRPFTSEQVAAFNFRHGEAVRGKMTPEYNAFRVAKCRCARGNDYRFYSNYRGRGIKFLFSSFHEFLKCLGRRPSTKHVLDRIDNDGNYEPGNVRWATISESMKNRRLTNKMLRASMKNLRKAQKLRWP